MKIGIKLISAMLFLVLIIVVMGYVLTLQVKKTSLLLNERLHQNISSINQNLQLKDFSKYFLYYDEKLTQSARNYIHTQEFQWKDKYYDAKKYLDQHLLAAKTQGNTDDNLLLENIFQINSSLRTIEKQILDFIDSGQKEKALNLLNSDNYQSLKKSYTENFSAFEKQISKKLSDTVYSYQQQMGEHKRHTQEVIKSSEYTVIIISLISLVLALILGLFLTISISNPIQQLKEKTQIISEGNFDTLIQTRSNDEIGELAASFNSMTQKLTKAINKERESIMLEATAEANQKKAQELDLLNKKLLANDKRLQKANQDLAKSKELLADQIQKLEKNNKSMMGREMRIIELKEENKKLREKINKQL